MTITYQSTFEEFEEGTKAINERLPKRNPRKQMIFMFVLVGYVVGAMYFWLWILPTQSAVVMFHIYGPIVLIAVLMFLMLILVPLLQGRMPRISRKTLLKILPLAIPAVAIVAIFKFDQMLPNRYQDPWNWALLLPHTTWLGLVAWITAMTMLRTDKQRKETWEDRAGLNRQKTAEITADGFALKDAVTTAEFRWEAFMDFQETKKLFLLYTSAKTAQYIPKRAFDGDEQLNAMRALMELIPRRTNTGFPLQPMAGSAQPPPLPKTA